MKFYSKVIIFSQENIFKSVRCLSFCRGLLALLQLGVPAVADWSSTTETGN